MSRIPSTSLALQDDGHCFACGDKNPEGLQIRWSIEGQKTSGHFVPRQSHQGWKGILHGGILATVLDEAMTRLIWKVLGDAMTVEMTVRYRQPARVGEQLHVEGEILKDTGRLVTAKAQVTNAEGQVVASSEGKALRVRGN